MNKHVHLMNAGSSFSFFTIDETLTKTPTGNAESIAPTSCLKLANLLPYRSAKASISLSSVRRYMRLSEFMIQYLLLSVFIDIPPVFPLFLKYVADKLFHGRCTHGGVAPGDVEDSRHPVFPEPYAGFVQLWNKGF